MKGAEPLPFDAAVQLAIGALQNVLSEDLKASDIEVFPCLSGPHDVWSPHLSGSRATHRTAPLSYILQREHHPRDSRVQRRVAGAWVLQGGLCSFAGPCEQSNGLSAWCCAVADGPHPELLRFQESNAMFQGWHHT